MTNASRISAALLFATLGCGARSELDRPGPSTGGSTSAASGSVTSTSSGSCTPMPPSPTSPCTAWQLGKTQIVAPPPPPDVGMEAGAIIASGCGALTAWFTLDGHGAGTVAWTTRAMGFDGAPLAPAVPHPTLTATSHASASISIAKNGVRLGAAVNDETGCRFLALDAEGHDQGSAIPLGKGLCEAIAPLGSGWSLLRAAPSGLTPASLDVLDPTTGQQTVTPLATPSGQILWDRLVFDDGTFLTDTFFENATTTVYTDWLQPFDAKGATLGPQIPVSGFNSAPVWLVATKNGALAAWSWQSLTVMPIDRTGVPTGPPHAIVSAKSIYEMTVVPVPNGDVLLAWIELEPSNNLTMYVQALAPDGAVRGPATLLADHVEANRIYGVVEPSGSRALLVQPGAQGLVALPLTCVTKGN